MMQRPPSSRQRQAFAIIRPEYLSQGLRSLGLFLFGAGLGVAGYGWLTSGSSSSADTLPGILPILSNFSQGLTAESETQNRNTQQVTPIADVADATICVKTSGPNGQDSCASGVSIDPQLAGIDPKQGSIVLTNYHVIYDSNRPSLQLGGQGEVFSAEVIRQSPEFDLAVLLVPKAKFPVAALAEASPDQGTTVRAIGFPNNQPLTIKDSRLLGKTQMCLAVSPCLALEQGTITYGNSGGPLEANGQVVGITQGELRDEVAIPVEQIRQFLAGQTPANSGNQFPNQFQDPYGQEFPGRRRMPSFPPGAPPYGAPSYGAPPYGAPPYGYPPYMYDGPPASFQ